MNFLIPFVTSIVISFVLTKYLRLFCYRKKILHQPRSRDIHTSPLPRIGGVAIALTFLFITLVFSTIFFDGLKFGQSTFLGLDKHFLGIIVGGLLIAGSMLYDDIFGLRAWQKLFIQVFAALVVIASGIGIDHLSNPFGESINLNSLYIPIFKYNGIVYHFSVWSDLLTLIWVVGMMNVINFVDGVDGLAGGLSIIAAVTIFLLSRELGPVQNATAFLSLVLAGSIIGFLFWNFPPAKIFMGDSGSMFIGFLLGVLPLISGGKLATVFLVLGFPIVDGLFVAISRAVRGLNPVTTPDKTHLHHRFLKAGFTQRQAVIILYLISAAFGWVALRSTTSLKLLASAVLLIVIIVLISLLNLLAKRKKHVGEF